MKKRLLSLLLAIVMIVSVCPVTTFAAGSLSDFQIMSDGPHIQENPLFPDQVFDSELEFPQTPASTQATNTSDYMNVNGIALEIRENMENRSGEFSLKYHHVSSKDIDTVKKEISAAFDEAFEIALAHTGVPTEGDYLKWHWARYGWEWTGSNSGSDYYIDFTVVFEYYTTASQENTVTRNVSSLLSQLNLSGKSDYEKVCGIYDWLCYNVTYDHENLDDDSYMLKFSAYAALMDRTAVCQGYALLFYRLALELGVDARLIAGLGNGGPHAWNIVELDDLYYNLDSTWDASYAEAGLDYEFFLVTDANFPDHERYDDYTTSSFYRQYPMASSNYGSQDTPDTPSVPGEGSGVCGPNVTWTLSGTTLTLSGSGAMYDYEEVEDLPWVSFWDDVTKIVVESGITAIGKLGLAGFMEATQISLPSTLKSIGQYAFMDCNSLTSLQIPSGVTTIDSGAFAYCDSMKSVTIPGTVQTMGTALFYECYDLAEVTLSEGLTTLSGGMFAYCTSLKEITIPASVTALKTTPFDGCTGLKSITFKGNAPTFASDAFETVSATAYYPANNSTWTSSVRQNYGGSITWVSYGGDDPAVPGEVTWSLSNDGVLTISGTGAMPDFDDAYHETFPVDEVTSIVIEPGITAIGKNAFFNMSNVTSVSIPNTVTSIGFQAFSWCRSLKSVTIPSSVTTIEGYAFNATGLTSVRIPASVTAIKQGVFGRCENLTSITVASGNSEYYSDGGVLFSYDNWLMQYPAGLSGHYAVPEGTTWLYHYAFMGCTNLTSVTLPKTLTGIGAGSFKDCTGLTELYFTGDAPTFNEGGDNSAASFLNVTATAYYPKDNGTWTRDIRQNYGGDIYWAAYDPNGDTHSCGPNLTWSVSGSTLTISGTGAMYDYEELEDLPWVPYWDEVTKIVVGEGVTAIGKQGLAGFANVTQISLPSTLKTIGTYAFVDCVALTSLQIPSGVTTISDGAFGYCHALKSVTIPGTVQTLGTALFYQCYDLTDVTLSEGLTTLSGGMFAYCTALKEITIPASVTALKASPFDGCTGLKSITFKGNAPTFASDAFETVTATAYYPADNSTWTSSVRQNYGGSITWVSYGGGDDPTVPGEISWSFKNGVLTISGTGAMPDYDGYEEVPWLQAHRYDITRVVIEPGITYIGSSNFEDCYNLTSVEIPNTVTSIGDCALFSCDSLTSITIPSSVLSIGRQAFSYCDSLKNVTFNEGLQTIGNWAFSGCTSLTSVVIPASVTSIGCGPFSGCSNLSKITVQSGNSKYYTDSSYVLFNNDKELIQAPGTLSGTYTIPNGTTMICESAFELCGQITQVNIPASVTFIESYAFYNCSKLANIQVDSGNARYYNDAQGALYDADTRTLMQVPGAFSGRFTVPSGIRTIHYYAFYGCMKLTSVVIASSVNQILYAAFDNCTSLKQVIFCGNAPSFGEEVFHWEQKITAYYPSGNSTWTSDVRQDYGGDVTWVSYNPNDGLPPENVPVNNPFTDVKTSDYYYDAVMWALQNDITSGTSANKFSPNMTCTRGQVVTFLWRAAGEPEPSSKVNPFTDVKSSDYFYKAVLWAVENGITAGIGNGKFGPNNACTRAQVATFLWRAVGEPEATSGNNPFSDVRSSDYYYEAVLWAVENGITSGTGNGKFSPSNACTRGQIVTFLYRAYS